MTTALKTKNKKFERQKTPKTPKIPIKRSETRILSHEEFIKILEKIKKQKSKGK